MNVDVVYVEFTMNISQCYTYEVDNEIFSILYMTYSFMRHNFKNLADVGTA